jgi:PleD family two-component response regulator
MKSILVAEASVLKRAEIASVFDRCYRLIPVSEPGELLPALEEFKPEVLLIAQDFPGNSLLLIEKAIAASPCLLIVTICETGDMDFAVNALKAGAVTVITGVPAPEVLYSSVAGKIPPDGGSRNDDMPWKIKGC